MGGQTRGSKKLQVVGAFGFGFAFHHIAPSSNVVAASRPHRRTVHPEHHVQ